MRRIKNWKNWIAESLEQNPLTNLPEGVTLYTNRMEALDKKEEFFYKKIPNSLKKRDTRENWEEYICTGAR